MEFLDRVEIAAIILSHTCGSGPIDLEIDDRTFCAAPSDRKGICSRFRKDLPVVKVASEVKLVVGGSMDIAKPSSGAKINPPARFM